MSRGIRKLVTDMDDLPISKLKGEIRELIKTSLETLECVDRLYKK